VKTFAVLVEYQLPDDADFAIAVRPMLEAVRDLSPCPPSNVTAFADDAAARAAAVAHSDMPAALLAKLAAAWGDQKTMSFVQCLYAAQAQDPEFPPIIERMMTEQVARDLHDVGRILLTTSGPTWTRLHRGAELFGTAIHETPPLNRQPNEVDWKPGDYAAAFDVLLCRITGTTIPTLTEEAPA
jgi:hypothetical protein